MFEDQKSLDARGNKVHMVGRHVVLLLNLTMFTFLLSDSLVLATILPSCKHSTPNAPQPSRSLHVLKLEN
jgi:hypothetical protein